MPLFEYVCRACGKRFTFLTGVVAENTDPTCPVCRSSDLKKLISRFSRGRSDDDRLDSMADQMDSQDFEDPRALRRFAREMGKEMGAETGEDLSDELEALIESEASEDEGCGPGGCGHCSKDDGNIY